MEAEPNKPEMGKEILEGVGQEELSNGFDISVGIDGKGASVNDIETFVSLNDASEELIEKKSLIAKLVKEL